MTIDGNDLKLLGTKPYQKHFEEARHGYITGLISSERIVIESLYQKYSGNRLSGTCSKCLMKMVVFLSNLYEKTKAKESLKSKSKKTEKENGK